MSVYSASYNFPPGFLWGTSADMQDAIRKDNAGLLYNLRDNSINAFSLILKWNQYEPLKNNYDELLIETTRSVFSRLHSQNVEPILILDIGTIPIWQNLEKSKRKETFFDERYNFAIHMANALIPYTKYFGLTCTSEALYSDKALKEELRLYQEIRKNVQSISEQVRVGIIIPADAFLNKGNGFFKLVRTPRLNALKGADYDFLGINSDVITIKTVADSLSSDKKPLLFYNDNMMMTAPESQTDLLADKIFGTWQLYLQGWPVFGYCSETDLSTASTARNFMTMCSKNNAFEISTENPNLSEKWIRFLKE